MTEFSHPGNPDVFPLSALSNSNQKDTDDINFLDAPLQQRGRIPVSLHACNPHQVSALQHL